MVLNPIARMFMGPPYRSQRGGSGGVVVPIMGIMHACGHASNSSPNWQILEDLRKKGEPVPDDPFDSNCITPGTAFMDRLGKHLRFFIRKKIAEDPLWQQPEVVFSGACNITNPLR